MKDISRKELLRLPHRNWSAKSDYSSLIVFPAGRKHESGYGRIIVIGCRDCEPIEIVSTSTDDLQMIGVAYRVECLFRAKAFNFWGRDLNFKVFSDLSSLEVHVTKKYKGGQS